VPPVRGPGAPQSLNEHPWSAQSHAFAILFLPCLITDLFEDDGVAHAHDFMRHASVQALAVRCQFAFSLCLTPAGAPVVVTPGARFTDDQSSAKDFWDLSQCRRDHGFLRHSQLSLDHEKTRPFHARRHDNSL
jgi:hypothetical protein